MKDFGVMKIGRWSRSKSKYSPLLQSKSRRYFSEFRITVLEPYRFGCLALQQAFTEHIDHDENDSANDGGFRTGFGIPVETLCPLLFARVPFGPRT